MKKLSHSVHVKHAQENERIILEMENKSYE